jgi:hypothetical protein
MPRWMFDRQPLLQAFATSRGHLCHSHHPWKQSSSSPLASTRCARSIKRTTIHGALALTRTRAGVTSPACSRSATASTSCSATPPSFGVRASPSPPPKVCSLSPPMASCPPTPDPHWPWPPQEGPSLGAVPTAALAALAPSGLGIDPKALSAHLACSDAAAHPLLDDLEHEGIITLISKRPRRIQRALHRPKGLFS